MKPSLINTQKISYTIPKFHTHEIQNQPIINLLLTKELFENKDTRVNPATPVYGDKPRSKLVCFFDKCTGTFE